MVYCIFRFYNKLLCFRVELPLDLPQFHQDFFNRSLIRYLFRCSSGFSFHIQYMISLVPRWNVKSLLKLLMLDEVSGFCLYTDLKPTVFCKEHSLTLSPPPFFFIVHIFYLSASRLAYRPGWRGELINCCLILIEDIIMAGKQSKAYLNFLYLPFHIMGFTIWAII